MEEVLGEEFLNPLGMSADTLATALRSAIVKGGRLVTADTGLRLGAMLTS